MQFLSRLGRQRWLVPRYFRGSRLMPGVRTPLGGLGTRPAKHIRGCPSRRASTTPARRHRLRTITTSPSGCFSHQGTPSLPSPCHLWLRWLPDRPRLLKEPRPTPALFPYHPSFPFAWALPPLPDYIHPPSRHLLPVTLHFRDGVIPKGLVRQIASHHGRAFVSSELPIHTD